MEAYKNSDLWYSEYHIEDVKLSLEITKYLHVEDSPFQHIEMMHNETYGNFMTLDGYIQVTERDEFVYHDMIVHPSMATNPAIKNILIIGGGDGGTAREAARYKSVEKIDMVEIDERVVRLCQQYLPTMSCMLEKDPRINLFFEDGLAFVKNAKDGAYDLILVDSTDPIGPGEGLFTYDFYSNCFRALTPNGILINQHECAFFPRDTHEMKRAHEKIRKVFPIAKVYGFNVPTYSTGYWYFGFASKNLDPIKDHKPEVWESFGLKTKYYNSDLHNGCFALPTYVRDVLAAE